MKLVERANAGLHSHVDQVLKQLGAKPDHRLLDLGCGTGAFLVRLKAAGYRGLHGIDIKVPGESIEGIEFHEFDLDSSSLPLPEASFDFITSIEVFEHVENLGTLVAEIARILKPGGSLIMTTPNIHSAEARLRFLLVGKLKQFDDLSDPTHIAPIFLHAFKRLLKRHGLQIVKLGSFPDDGFSPTSRPPLRFLAKLLSVFGVRGDPAGDHLSLVIAHEPGTTARPKTAKQAAVTGHYETSPLS